MSRFLAGRLRALRGALRPRPRGDRSHRLHGRAPGRPARARDGRRRSPPASRCTWSSQARQRRRTESVEHRYRTLVEELPAALYISSLDKTSNALYVSPAIVELLGYSLDEWARKPQLFDEILHPLDRDDVLTAIEAAKHAGEPYEAEYRVFRDDGSIVWVRDRAVTVRDARGRPLHWQGFLVDVTERKHAEVRYRTLAEQLPLITYIDTPYSTDEAAAYVSPQVEDILGYSLAEWQADPHFFVDHLHPEDRERVREAQRVARESGDAARGRVSLHREGRPDRLAPGQLHRRPRRDRVARGTRRDTHSTSLRASRPRPTARRC